MKPDQARSMMARCLLAFSVTLVLAASLAAADLSGTWSLELDPDFSGNQDTVGCGFAQDGNKLAIKCGGSDIAGEVNGLR
jgi:hypothetical protein